MKPHTIDNRASAPVFVVDDDDATSALVARVLKDAGLRAETFADARDAIAAAERETPCLVVTDHEMTPTTGVELAEIVRRRHPSTPVIVMTGHADVDHAVQALRAGVWDFLTKPLEVGRLVWAAERACEHFYLHDEVRRLRMRVEDRTDGGSFHSIIGKSDAMKRVFDLLCRVAPTDAPALLQGQSGTGKELAARALHEESSRRDGPFIAINCAAVPESLIESELFGHVKGAFTDANRDRAGLFVEANGGTLFLDEIGELPLVMQPKLLRALQERRVRPVGGDREVSFDARIVAATNRDLRHEVAEGRFREGLFYRLNMVGVEIPPLAERGMDVLLLAHHFLEVYSERFGKEVTRITPEAAERLMSCDWPGNVRELENCVGRAVALSRGEKLDLADLSEPIRSHRATRVPEAVTAPEQFVTLAELEARYLRRVLDALEGNKSEAARILGIDRRTLYRRLAKSEERDG